MEIRKLLSRVSKAFSISIVTRKPVILNQPLISIMPKINVPLSPINLFFTQGTCCEEVNVGRTTFNLYEIALDKRFVPTFNKEMAAVFSCIVYYGLFSQ